MYTIDCGGSAGLGDRTSSHYRKSKRLLKPSIMPRIDSYAEAEGDQIGN